MSDAIDKLNVTPEIKACLREIKAEVEGAYTDRIAQLEADVVELRTELRIERRARLGSSRRPPPNPPKAAPR